MRKNNHGVRVLALAAVLLAFATDLTRAQAVGQKVEGGKPGQAVEQKVEAAKPQTANVRVEVLLTDKADAKTITEERLTLLLADGADGRVRRNLPDRVPHANRELQVDAKAFIVRDRVRLFLTLQYNAALSPDETATQPGSIGFLQMASAFLEPGKPTVMIDGGGSPANRRVTLQATATILR